MVRAIENRFIFFPDGVLSADPGQIGMPFEDLEIQADEGVVLHGWWIPAAQAEDQAPVIIFFHGNAGNISHRLSTIQLLRDLGVTTCIFDYRGYGRSTGTPTEAGVYADAQAVYRHCREVRRVAPDRILLFGRSLGGAVAIDLATQVPIAGLIVEGTFTHAADMARQMPLGWFLKKWIQTKFDNLEKVRTLALPKLFIHGTADQVVPFAYGQRLFEAAGEPKEWYAVEKGRHENTPQTGGREYRGRVAAFIARAVSSVAGQ